MQPRSPGENPQERGAGKSERSPLKHPAERVSDLHGWRRWWARALRVSRVLWPILVSGVVLWSAVVTQQVANDTAKTANATAALVIKVGQTRVVSIRDSCHADVAQDDVLRAILRESLRARRKLDRAGGKAPDGLTYEEAVRLSEKLMEPLSGLAPSKEAKKAICDRRVARALPDPQKTEVAPSP